jgi:hypothetical protein
MSTASQPVMQTYQAATQQDTDFVTLCFEIEKLVCVCHRFL